MKWVLVIASLAVFTVMGFGAYLAVDAQQGGTRQEGREATLADIKEWQNPPGADKYPPIVARLTSGEFSVDVSGEALAAVMNRAEKEGRPISERQARDGLTDTAVLDLAVQKRGLEGTEQRARELYETSIACLRGTPTAVPGMSCSSPPRLPPPEIQAIGDYILANSTEEEMIKLYQKAVGLGRLRSEIVRDLTDEELTDPEVLNQMYKDFAQKEKASVVVIEIDFRTDGRIECSRSGLDAECPSDILALTETPIPVPTRQAGE
jgi:hypothetical protein